MICINDISKNLESYVKLFANATTICSVVFYPNLSAIKLNNDLLKIQQWAYQWKMSFNPDPTKQAQKLIINKPYHPDLIFNQTNVNRT